MTILSLAHSVIHTEIQELNALVTRLDDSFTKAVDCILNCHGRIVVSGVGKSGHIAGKIASTLASTGTPAFFMHPAEASHGDLGMITADDVLLVLSNSGESEEILTILPIVKRLGATIVAISGNSHSRLAQFADHFLDVKVSKEACPLGLTPTASTTAMLVLGDALAVCALSERDFSAEDFARSHPAGRLGIRSTLYVKDIMRTQKAIPKVYAETSVTMALLEISEKNLGLTAVVEHDDKLIGVFSDGDFRRAYTKTPDISQLTIQSAMRTQPHTIKANLPAIDAVGMMERHKINALLVVDNTNTLIGALNMHDLLLAKVV